MREESLVNLVVLFAALALGAGLGPDVGSIIPKADRFGPEMGDAGATLVFVRSVDWCPYCRTQVTDLAARSAEFEAEGRPLVFVSYDSAETQARFAREAGVDAAFIADEGSVLIRAFGLLNENHAPGTRAYGIPHPAVFIIDADGAVAAKLHETDWASSATSYRRRPAVEAILTAAREAR